MGFSNILGEAEIHSIPKMWENWIPIVREKFGKVQTFQIEGFLHVWYEAEIHLVPKAWEKGISIVQEKYGKPQAFQIYEFVKYFGWSKNPYNFQNMGKVNLHSTEKIWENTEISHILRYSQIWSWWEPLQFPIFGNVQIPVKWKYSAESHILTRLWIFEEIRSYYETQIIHIVWVM